MMRRSVWMSAVLGMASASVAPAQGDASLAQAYAAQCPNDEQTEVCRLLKDAIVRDALEQASATKAMKGAGARPAAMVRISDDPRWGVFAALAGRDWRARGTNIMFSFRTVSPNEMTIGYGWDKGTTVDRWGARLTENALQFHFHNEPWRDALITDKGDLKVQYKPGKYVLLGRKTAAGVFLYVGNLVLVDEDEQKFRDVRDRWVAAGLIAPQGQAGTAGAASVARPIAPPVLSLAAAQLPQAVERMKGWAGDWSNGNRLWRVAVAGDGVSMTLWGQEDGQVRQTGPITPKGEALYWNGVKLTPLANGFYRHDYAYSVEFIGPDRMQARAGKLIDGAFVPGKVKPMIWLGDYRRLSSAETAAWRQQAERNRVALAQQKASRGGGGGLFGALAMGFGAALAGGNAEMVMGAAMKGAELTTNNEMSRNVLAGQGDQMIQDGADRMAAENAQRMRAAQAQADAARARQAPRTGSSTASDANADGGGGAIVVAQAAPPPRPAAPAPRPAVAAAAPKVTYFDCYGQTKKTITTAERGRHDAVDTIFYGIVSARGEVYPQDAENLFRQQTGSRGSSNTEDAGTSCHPYGTRAAAQSANQSKISRDGRLGAKQVTGIELSL